MVSTHMNQVSSEEEAELRKKAAKAVLDLKKHGWACIDGIIPQEECDAYVDGFWDWIEGLGTGVSRHDPSTWQPPKWAPSFRGIINSLEIAHSAFVWRIRKQPRLLKIFEELWGSAALLSSFDSINALQEGAEPPTQAWLHVDQAPLRKGICCVQGLVNLVPVSPSTTGTLLVKDGTQDEHERFFTEVSRTSRDELARIGDHYQFKPEELQHWEPYKSVGVSGKAGSLFLWDSRTVHANVFPSKTESFRHVVYTCYQPTHMATEADLKEKQRMYEEFLISTHWPAMNIAAHGNGEDYYNSGEKKEESRYKINRDRHLVEDERLLKLAGVLPYSEKEARKHQPLMDLKLSELAAIAAA